MVKSVLSVSHRGLRDWAIQRISAMIIAIGCIMLMGYYIYHPHLAFNEWQQLFTPIWIKIFSLLFILSMIFHAWIGVWTIVTDYISCYMVRAVFHLSVFLVLFASFLWGILILWSA